MREHTRDWVNYERERKGSVQTFTRRADAPQPTGRGWLASPATPDEVKAELAKVAKTRKQIEAHTTFIARPDYRDTDAIRSLIELMTPECHPLDKLTPEQWTGFKEETGRFKARRGLHSPRSQSGREDPSQLPNAKAREMSLGVGIELEGLRIGRGEMPGLFHLPVCRAWSHFKTSDGSTLIPPTLYAGR